MAIADRLDRFERRHRWAGFPLAVLYKFFDDHGNHLAALITYYAFLSLFPLLLLLASLLGFVLRDNPDLEARIVESTLSQFPVVRDELRSPGGLEGNGLAIVVGGLVALYGALGVAQALQHTMNTMWAVPRHQRPNPVASRLRSLLLIGTVGIAALGTTGLSALASGARSSGGGAVVAATALSTAASVAVFLVAFRITTARSLALRQLAPGAVIAALVWQLLQLFGAAYVARVLDSASSTYGTFALVLGLLAWLYLAALGVVVAVEVNVVRAKHLYPRALLTPFTDDVDLTSADRRTYADAAVAQRAKGFETVDVSFEHDGQNATRLRRRRDGG